MSVYSLDHPEIMEAERHGSLCRDEVEIVGACENCGEVLTTEYEYYVDGDGNKFCSDDCYIDFYKIKKVG